VLRITKRGSKHEVFIVDPNDQRCGLRLDLCRLWLLGCYFSFFVCPDFFVPSGSSQADHFIGNTGYNFPLQFGVLGLAVMLIALLRFCSFAQIHPPENDDKIVRASFLCYVAIGYVFCRFLLHQRDFLVLSLNR
jgi:hypothetical protein